jgi:hypothetical protein
VAVTEAMKNTFPGAGGSLKMFSASTAAVASGVTALTLTCQPSASATVVPIGTGLSREEPSEGGGVLSGGVFSGGGAPPPPPDAPPAPRTFSHPATASDDGVRTVLERWYGAARMVGELLLFSGR